MKPHAVPALAARERTRQSTEHTHACDHPPRLGRHPKPKLCLP